MPEQYAFIACHPYNVEKMIENKKEEECKNTRTSAKYIVVATTAACSNRWPKPKRKLKLGHVYVLARIKICTPSSNESFKYDWRFEEKFIFDPPVCLGGKTVGQGIRFANGKNKHLIKPLQYILERAKSGE